MASSLESRDLECPVCFEQPNSTPIFQCSNGHLICKECHEMIILEMNQCPICKVQPLGNNRNLIAEKLLQQAKQAKSEVTSKTSCKYESDGCTIKCKQADKSLHESECKYRVVKCPDTQCNFESPMVKMSTHFKFDHSEICKKSDKDDIFVDRGTIKFSSTCISSFLLEGKRFFFIKHTKLPGCRHSNDWMFWLYFAGTPRQAKQYVYELSIVGIDGKDDNYFGEVISLDVPCDDVYEKCSGIGFSFRRRADTSVDFGKPLEYVLTVRSNAAYSGHSNSNARPQPGSRGAPPKKPPQTKGVKPKKKQTFFN